MMPSVVEANESNPFVPLTLAREARVLTPGVEVAINPHTRVTRGLGIGGPCDGRTGVVVIEMHGVMNPQEVMAVRCAAADCEAAFFP